MLSHSELNRKELIEHVIEQFNINQEQFNLNQVKIKELQAEMKTFQDGLLSAYEIANHDPLIDLYDLEGSDEGDMEIDSHIEEPLDTLLIGDEVISTIPAREIDEFIMFSVDDLVLIPRESKVTSL
ncbi:hypothetical protein Tco_0241577 [Tanacetum coccineum]